MSIYDKAVVATGHPLVSAAATEILKEGGNAFDAAVAAGFAGVITEPALTSLGGGGFLLARTLTPAGKSDEILFDFFVDTPGLGLDTSELEPHFFPVTVHFPGSDQDFNVGLGSVAVPGNLKGFLHVHKRLGRIPLKKVLQPAVKLARDGVTINDSQACFLKLLTPIMTLTETGRKFYQKNGNFISSGDHLHNQELADFLEQLPDDMGKSFYQGKLSEAIDHDMREGQGLLTAEDLAAYRVIERKPLETDYRGRTLLTNPPPSLGGTLISLALQLLSTQTMRHISSGSPEHLSLLGKIFEEVENLRQKAITEEMIKKSGDKIRLWSKGTTHLSIADAEGNVASMTTSNGEGSGYFVPGTGIMLNNMMGEDDLHPEGFHASPPGQRVASMMSPSVLLRDGLPELVLGSGGSKRIRTAITQVINQVVDFGFAVQQAVEAPRIHWDCEKMQVEPGLPDETIEKLRSIWDTNVWPGHDMYFGGVHAVVPGHSGAGDHRRGGSAGIVRI
jgi:gamma-glutamyltranspeptidase/glutathione hydrolase